MVVRIAVVEGVAADDHYGDVPVGATACGRKSLPDMLNSPAGRNRFHGFTEESP